MARLTLNILLKIFPGGVRAVDGVSLDVADGELVVLVGPSGSGKSTLLRLVAGLGQPDGGEIRFDGEPVNRLPPRRRDVAMAFQTPALYPHLSVRDNLGMSLRLRKTPGSIVRDRVQAAAASLQLQALLDRKPAQLSGGERQRVALGRALVRQPRCCLLDEPMAHLDAPLREQLRLDLLSWHRQRPTTTLYVTHDQHEALLVGHRVVVLAAGKVQQSGVPLEIYDRPANRFVAGFFGTPHMHFLDGRLMGHDGALWFENAAVRLRLQDESARRLSDRNGAPGQVGLRPEAVRAAPADCETNGGTTFTATVLSNDLLGDCVLHHLVTTDGTRLASQDAVRTALEPGTVCQFVIDPARMHFFALDSIGANLLL